MAYTYKVVPFIGKIKSNQTAADVSAQMQDLINSFAAQDWEYVSMENVNIQVQPGCLPGLLGAKESYIRFDQIVFRKAV